jgi:hypothetical protein
MKITSKFQTFTSSHERFGSVAQLLVESGVESLLLTAYPIQNKRGHVYWGVKIVILLTTLPWLFMYLLFIYLNAESWR